MLVNPSSLSAPRGEVTIEFEVAPDRGERAEVVLFRGRRRSGTWHVRLGRNGQVRWHSPLLATGVYAVELLVHRHVVRHTVVHVTRR